MYARLAALCRTVLLGVALVITFTATASASPAAGEVRFAQEAKSSFDRFTQAPSAESAAWMRDHYHRMRTYAPYFDGRVSWFSNAWSYKDAYAIYKDDSATQTAHPEWMLKDPQGKKLFIPYGCVGGTCPLYAADIGNPAFRQNWINEARETMAQNYKGLFVDDVNMEFRVGNQNGDQTAPMNPRTGQVMTASEWRGYMADFMQEIRAAFPSEEIVHNSLWFAGTSDPDVRRQLHAADVINLERGVVDGGITAGGGQFGLETFLSQIDWLHSQGKAVTFDSYAADRQSAEYNLASYFLVNGAEDTFRSDWRSTPEDWWTGYDTSLGAPKGKRYVDANGLLRRDFDRGYVLVNQPGRAPVTVNTPGGAGPDGEPRATVRVAGGQGVVVLGQVPAPAASGASLSLRPVPNPLPASVPGNAVPKPNVAPRKRMRGSVLVRGSVRRPRGGKVHVEVRRRVGSSWFTAGEARVRVGRNGRFARLFTNLRRGKYSARGRYLEASTSQVKVASRGFVIRR